MKRNRLLNSSPRSRLFTSEKTPHSKQRHILALSLLTVVGVFLTTIVLATSTPVSTETKSQNISLPNQSSIETESTTSSVKSQTLQLSLAEPSKANKTNSPEVEYVPVPDQTDISITEPSEVERIHLQQETQQESVKNDIDVQAASDMQLDWHEVTVKSGDNLSLIFPRVGLSARDVYNVAQTGEAIKPLLNLKPGQIMRFGLAKGENNKASLQRLELQLSAVEKLQLTSADTGFETQTLTRETDKRQKQVTGQIESSLFEAGLKSGMTDKVIMELAHIFGWDIDFALDLRQGDSFKVIFEEAYLDGKKFANGDILAAEFTNRGKTFQAIRYTDDEGNSHFYAPNGDSMRKTFTRTPVHFSRISSRFNPNRKHPVLKTSRPHRGVDYAAPTGTPILATGDGKVAFVGTKGGYGRTVVLSHGGKYTTLYAHMSRYKKGLKSGHRVKQGQTIGYIGSSGLATGPHLHYEFRVNGVHRNPLTVALPQAEPLNAKYMADFKQKAQPLLAQLEQLEQPVLALNEQ
jgi:murein DD-endopeptidase MepM/ murein hydrolase activator NlpD